MICAISDREYAIVGEKTFDRREFFARNPAQPGGWDALLFHERRSYSGGQAFEPG